MKKKLTIPQFRELKADQKRFSVITAYDYSFASLVNASEIEVILVGDSLGMVVLGYDSTVPVTMADMVHHTKAVVRGAKDTFVVADLPFGSYNTGINDAMRNANRLLKEAGADAVKLEGGASVVSLVEEMVKGGIPVVGHIGLTPQTAAQLGGFKVQGKSVDAARQLIDDALQLEHAGAFALTLECIPAPVAKLITDKLSIPTIGIGAGAACDSQVLVIHDALGLYERFTPKFVKQYAQLNGSIMGALNQYAAEVAAGSFPGPEHSFTMKEEDMARLY